MPAYGCHGEALEPLAAGWLACGGFNVPQDPDPWVVAEWSGGWAGLELNVKVAAKRTPEDWSEASGRASRLHDGGWIDLTSYVKEAVGYSETHQTNDSLAFSFFDQAASLGHLGPDGNRVRPHEGATLIQIVGSYCQLHPDSSRCSKWRVSIDHQISKYRGDRRP